MRMHSVSQGLIPVSASPKSFGDLISLRCQAQSLQGGWHGVGAKSPCIWRWWPARLHTHPEYGRVTGPQLPPRQSPQHC